MGWRLVRSHEARGSLVAAGTPNRGLARSRRLGARRGNRDHRPGRHAGDRWRISAGPLPATHHHARTVARSADQAACCRRTHRPPGRDAGPDNDDVRPVEQGVHHDRPLGAGVRDDCPPVHTRLRRAHLRTKRAGRPACASAPGRSRCSAAVRPAAPAAAGNPPVQHARETPPPRSRLHRAGVAESKGPDLAGIGIAAQVRVYRQTPPDIRVLEYVAPLASQPVQHAQLTLIKRRFHGCGTRSSLSCCSPSPRVPRPCTRATHLRRSAHRR